jgi:ElaB/YqjD/DUF883 family membrane-anchored ribosome-binding protein
MDSSVPISSRGPEAIFESGKTQAMRAAEQLRSAAATTVQQFRTAAGEQTGTMRAAAETQADHLRDAAEQQWTQARSQMQDWQQDLEDYVRANPTKSILATFGLGLVVGMLLRK